MEFLDVIKKLFGKKNNNKIEVDINSQDQKVINKKSVKHKGVLIDNSQTDNSKNQTNIYNEYLKKYDEFYFEKDWISCKDNNNGNFYIEIKKETHGIDKPFNVVTIPLENDEYVICYASPIIKKDGTVIVYSNIRYNGRIVII